MIRRFLDANLFGGGRQSEKIGFLDSRNDSIIITSSVLFGIEDVADLRTLEKYGVHTTKCGDPVISKLEDFSLKARMSYLTFLFPKPSEILSGSESSR
jgi:hypothetical protein